MRTEEYYYIYEIEMLEMRDDGCLDLCWLADASQVAYATAIYLKSTDRYGKAAVNLITSKTHLCLVIQSSRKIQ